MDGNDSPHISYYDYGNGDLKYAKRSISPSQIDSSTGTGTASFLVSAGALYKPTAIAEGDLPNGGKPDVTFPHGLFSFKIMELTPGQTVVVTITLPSAIPTGTQYWKYHEPEGWVNVSSLLGDNDGDNILTLTLTDGGLGDDDGTANGVIVDAGGSGIPIPAPPPAPTPSRPAVGGGTGEYYLRVDVVGTKYRFLCEYIGKIEETGEVISPDEMLKITLPKGTFAKDKNGDALGRLNVSVNDNPPPPPADNQIIGLTYDFQPDGATFNPPITITCYYDPKTLPSGVIEKDLMLACYAKDKNAWVILEDSVVDMEQHTVTASVSYFTDFVVIGKITPPASLSVSNLRIQPTEVKPDEVVTHSYRN